MYMQLIILEDPATARAVAKSFGSEFKPGEDSTALIGGAGEKKLLLWLDKMRLLGGGKKPSLSEKAETLLTKIRKSHDITDVLVALHPTRVSALFTDSLRRALDESSISVSSAVLTTLRKADILSSLENAKRTIPDSPELIRATSDRNNQFILANAIRMLIPPEEGLRFDLNMLTALLLINEQEEREREKSYRIKADIEIEGVSYPALSEDAYTKDDAVSLIDDMGSRLTGGAVKTAGLPSVTSLYRVYERCEVSELNLKDTAVSLYEKRYISSPFTLCGSLPFGITNNTKGSVISACRAFFPGEDSLDIDSLGYFDVLSSPAPSAILPLKDTTGSLSEAEKLLYEAIVLETKEALCAKNIYTLPLREKKTGTCFSMPLPESMPRGSKSFSAGEFVLLEEGSFRCIFLKELMERLVSFGLCSSDVLMTLAERLIKTGTIRADNFGLHITGKGRKLIRALPLEAGKVFTLFRELNSAPRGDSELNTHLLNISNLANRTAAEWIALAGNVPDPSDAGEEDASEDTVLDEAENLSSEESVIPKDADAQAPSSEAVTYCVCPFCGEKAMLEHGDSYVCSSCGSILDKNLKLEDAFYSITEKDLFNISCFQRTKFKRGKDLSGNVVTGGYLTLQGGDFVLSHKSNYRCPYCGENLLAFSWGFKCSSCSFGVPFSVYGVRLHKDDILRLIAGEKTSVIKGLTSPKGQLFSARLLSLPDGKIRPYLVKNEEGNEKHI